MVRLYNNLELPEQWPPKYEEKTLDKPLEVPYLKEKQDIVNIEIGRQLFVDDFLIEESNLSREFHQPKVCEKPIFEPKTPLEMNGGYYPCACPFNDGIFYDDEDNKFKMWYHAGWFNGVGYAESEDGLNWKRLKELYPERESESVLPHEFGTIRDGAAVWIDYHATNRNERYKMFVFLRKFDFEIKYYHEKPKHAHDDPDSIPPEEKGVLFQSANGIDWEECGTVGHCGDNTGFYYNPFTNKWTFSLRTFSSLDRRIRTRGYYETDHFIKGTKWTEDDIVFWTRTDIYDRPDKDMGYYTQLYDVSATPYESLMLGVFSVFMGPPNDISGKKGTPKINDLKLAYSRDGFHWHRPSYENFISSSRKEGSWNYGYAHPVNGLCLVVEDEIYFYFSCFSGVSPKLGSHKYAGGNLGFAKLRRDGFVSLSDKGNGGELLTTKLQFDGNHLFVNVACEAGSVCAEILDEHSNVIEGYSKADCIPVTGDSTKVQIKWKNKNLEALKNKIIKIRFYLDNARIYSFWIAEGEEGHSKGFMAAGGPGFHEGRDVSKTEK
ncbi:hypothetical protein [Robertmurraya siralis]|uniref:hypothetical protein n=1 Tax=Robertmurraya siralis TaxID=77777 RepID=UPI0010F526A3|nr:hypothetical protein [Robertmurraya siralis]